MTRTALILAAHGSGDGSSQNKRVRALAVQLADYALFDDTLAAFNRGTPSFRTVLDETTATQAVVVPLMTSAGYFSRIVLPQELRAAQRANDVSVEITAPLGTHHRMSEVFANQLRATLTDFALPPKDTEVLVVGHGTERDNQSAATTHQLADAIGGQGLCAKTVAVFLDEAPRLEEAAAQLTCQHVVVLPFFLGGGHHTQCDIPGRLGLTVPPEAELPLRVAHAGRQFVLTDPLSDDATLVALIADLIGGPRQTLVAVPQDPGWIVVEVQPRP